MKLSAKQTQKVFQADEGAKPGVGMEGAENCKEQELVQFQFDEAVKLKRFKQEWWWDYISEISALLSSIN